ncbi:hypothetical protein FB464_3214 [Subtercola boreus]|nr:hypothetical protein FB464_3214 [Subtercola boreus]
MHTWALRTLEGSGSGVVGMSAEWPTPPSSLHPLVEKLVDFLPQGSSVRIREGLAPPRSSEFLVDDESRPILVVKRYLGDDGAGRPGRYIAHALLDPTRALTARTAWRIARSGSLPSEWRLEDAPDSRLPRVDPELLARRIGPLMVDRSARSRSLLITVLGILDTGRRVVISGESDPEPLLDTVFAVLPSRMTERLTFSTYHADPYRSGALLTFTAPAFTAESVSAADCETVVLLTGEAPSEPIARVVSALLAGERVPDDLEDVNAVDEYLRLLEALRIDPWQASLDRIVQNLASEYAERWLLQPNVLVSIVQIFAQLSASQLQAVASAVGNPGIRDVIFHHASEEGITLLEFDPPASRPFLGVGVAFEPVPAEVSVRVAAEFDRLLDQALLGRRHRDAFPLEFASVTAILPSGAPGHSPQAQEPSQVPLLAEAELPTDRVRRIRTVLLNVGVIALVAISGASLGIFGASPATWGALVASTSLSVATYLIGRRR